MNRHSVAAVAVLFAVSPLRAIAQPNVDPAAPTRPYSIAELERFLGGRTLVSVDLKDATLEQVAAALGESSGQKVVVRPPVRLPVTGQPASPPLFTLSAKEKPFWEALRGWQLEAQAVAEEAAAKAGPSKNPVLPFALRSWFDVAPNSLGMSKLDGAYRVEPSSNLVQGRAVSAWPFLIVGTNLKRSQEGELNEKGLSEIEALFRTRAVTPNLEVQPIAAPQAPATPLPAAPLPAAPLSEEKRWIETLTFHALAIADPKLIPGNLTCYVEEAIDDKGNDLRLPQTRVTLSKLLNYGPDGGAVSLQIPLLSRPDMGKRLDKLRGVLRFSVVTRSQHWETTDLDAAQLGPGAQSTVFQFGGDFNVQFKGLSKEGNDWVAKFTTQSRGAHLERFWKEAWQGRVYGPGSISGLLDFSGVPAMKFVDENGRTFPLTSRGETASIGGPASPARGGAPVETSPLTISGSPPPPDVAQSWHFDEERNFGTPLPSYQWGSGMMGASMMGAGTIGAVTMGAITMGRPVKLILDLPLERHQVSVPFEFTDLPLPPS